jgi:hypothetical protein
MLFKCVLNSLAPVEPAGICRTTIELSKKLFAKIWKTFNIKSLSEERATALAAILNLYLGLILDFSAISS